MTELEKKRTANRLRQRLFLERHRDEVNKKRRKKYAARKKEQRCPRCGKKLRSKNYILCKNCLENAQKYNNKR
jgi:hypothetical protein